MVEPRGDRRIGETITAEERLEESIPVEAGGTLYVNADRGQIDVSSHDANEVRVEAAARGWRAGLVLFSLEKSENDVHFDVSIDAFLPGFLGAAHITARIWVPPRYSVDLESAGGHVRVEDVCGRIDAHSRGGHMTATRIDGPVSLRTSGGHITVEQVDGDVRMQTSGGHIRVDDIVGDVSARTSGGHIRARDIQGQVEFRTSGGHIRVHFVEEACGYCQTSGGQIEVSFPEGAGVELDARTSGGAVRVEHPLEDVTTQRRSHVVGRIGGGGAPLELRTSGGQIRVLRG